MQRGDIKKRKNTPISREISVHRATFKSASPNQLHSFELFNSARAILLIANEEK